MKYKNQKKLQREINKFVKEMNKNIYNDNLWLGRFYARQSRADYYQFPDNSGGILCVVLKFVDKKTNYSKEYRLEYHGLKNFFQSDLFRTMNDFIIKDCEVWEKDDPYHNIIDFRGDKYVKQ